MLIKQSKPNKILLNKINYTNSIWLKINYDLRIRERLNLDFEVDVDRMA